MHYLRKAKLIWTFCNGFLFALLFITACSLLLFFKFGFSFFSVFWFKLITQGIVFYLVNDYRQKEYYYYLNTGISKRGLWAPILSLDFLLFLLLVILTYKIRWSIPWRRTVYNWNSAKEAFFLTYTCNVKPGGSQACWAGTAWESLVC